MAATSAVPFQWGAQGRKITTPEQAAKQRLVAEALMLSGKSPAANWAQGLGDVTGALTGSILNNEVNAAEEAGALEASGLFQGLGSSSPEADIIAALSNPWASDAQSSVAQALLGQQFQANDPMNQLRLAQAQLDYDQDVAGAGAGDETFFGNPIAIQTPDGIQYGQIGNRGGFKPIEIGEGNTFAPNTRTVDTGLELLTVGPGGEILSRTPKEVRATAAESAGGAVEGKVGAERNLEAPMAAANLQRLDAQTDNVISTVDKALGQAGPGETGLIGQIAGSIAGSKAFDLRETVKTIKANLGFNELQAMRDASPTGGALGAIAVQELEALQSTIASLNPDQSEAQLKENLTTIRDLLERQKSYRRAASEARFGGSASTPPSNPNAVVVDGFTIEAID
jgi:hypothetical protein